MDVSDLARLIRRRRLELRLTQREAARQAGVSLATWQSLERHGSEDREFQELTLARVADGLDLPDAEVFEAAGRTSSVAPTLASTPVRIDAEGGPGGAAEPAPHRREPWNDEAPRRPAELLDDLRALLLTLAERSEADFMLVYVQAVEAADHLLARYDSTERTPGRGASATGRPSGRSS